MKVSWRKNEEWERRKAFLMGKCVNVIPMSNIKSHFVTIDSSVLYGIMKEIIPEFDVNRKEFTCDNRETDWKNSFNFKRLEVNKQKVFTGMIENDGLAICVHYRRLKTDRPVPSSAKHEDEKDRGPATKKAHENDFVVRAHPGNTNIVTIAAPKRVEDGTDGNLRQKDMRLLRFSRARYYRESGIMDARKKIKTLNAGVRERLEARREVTSREADFVAVREFMEVRVAHWEALWKEYAKPMRALLRPNPYCGKQRAFDNFFNELSF